MTVWEYDSSGVAHEVKTYLYEDKDFPDELKLEENQTSTDKYSPVPAGVELALDIVTQVCNLIILAAFPYRKLWAQGDHDRNEINFGHLKEDTQRGLKVGLIADIPAILVYLSLWLGKLGVPLFEHTHALYTLFNSSFLPVLLPHHGARAAKRDRLVGRQYAWRCCCRWCSCRWCAMSRTRWGCTSFRSATSCFIKTNPAKRRPLRVDKAGITTPPHAYIWREVVLLNSLPTMLRRRAAVLLVGITLLGFVSAIWQVRRTIRP